MCLSHWSTARNAIARSQSIGGSTVFAANTGQAFGEGIGGTPSDYRLVDTSPYTITQLDTFEVLCQVIEPTDQAERIPQRREGGVEPGRAAPFRRQL